MLSVVVSICTPTYSLFTLFLSLNTTWSFLLETMAKCLFNAFPYLVFSFCSTVAQHIPCLFSLCCWGAILSICFISFAKPNSVGFLTVQTLSLYFLTSQVLLVCGRYFWCSSWTLLISSTFFSTWLFVQVRPGISKRSCWLHLRKSCLFNLLTLFCTTE